MATSKPVLFLLSLLSFSLATPAFSVPSKSLIPQSDQVAEAFFWSRPDFSKIVAAVKKGEASTLKLEANGWTKLFVEKRTDALVLTYQESDIIGSGLYYDTASDTFTIPQIGKTSRGKPFKGKVAVLDAQVDGVTYEVSEIINAKPELFTAKQGQIQVVKLDAEKGRCAMFGNFQKIIRAVPVLSDNFVLKFNCPTLLEAH